MEGLQVVSAEIWTTGGRRERPTGELNLDAALSQGRWAQLEASLSADDRAALPRVPEPARIGRVDDTRLGDGACRVWLLADDQGDPMPDIRTPADADAMERQLHDRVRLLRQRLPEEVQLLASIAGGRKSMSASLYTAMALQAGANSRLVHVLTHPAIETNPAELRDFYFPNKVWEGRGIPLPEQVTVMTQWFPRMQALLTHPQLDTGALGELFETGSPRDVTRDLDSRAAREIHAELRYLPPEARRDQGTSHRRPYRLRILERRRPDPLFEVFLGKVPGRLLWELAGARYGLPDHVLAGRISGEAVDAASPELYHHVTQAVSRLKTHTLKGLPPALRDFAPFSQDGVRRIPAAHLIKRNGRLPSP
ncbi:MAG: hypothetical protein KC613_16985 [Myxococcales bacterium]|nr:hypothetical protein [Myxococcales bacterium]MCB9524033.1 hypothetical protein [Myxococcales bacterium]